MLILDKRKVIYYENELEDEFSTAVITPKKIDGSWKYCHDSLFKKFTHFFWYRIVATPLAFLYTKIKFHHKTIGKEKLKPYKKVGYFLYGNHTHDIGDPLIPNMLIFPKTAYMIVHPNNVSMPYLGRITPSLGALPLPDDLAAYKNFIKAVDRRIAEGHAVGIYPEAHIWPYYTKIRPFKDDSFHYPVRLGAPVFCFTNTYQKRKRGKKPKIVTYVDGPFFADESVPARERKTELRNRVYDCMVERSKNSNLILIEYKKKGEKDG